MRSLKTLLVPLFAVFVVVAFQTQTSAQESNEPNMANLSAAGTGLRFDIKVSYTSGTLTIAAPDGRIFQQELKSGASPDFSLIDRQGERLPDGQYAYELRLSQVAPMSKEARAAAARRDEEPEQVRATRKRVAPAQSLQSGGFVVVNGSVVIGGTENGRSASNAEPSRQPARSPVGLNRIFLRHHAPLVPDQVIPDDLIVQGSVCAGLDCVNNENFGFDTIRLKENNTRIQFDDTSTSAGFATNNWQIRANNSASGGQSFLGFVDQGATGNSETGTVVFEVDAGAPANSLRVSSTGKIGIRTATPVLDVHANTSDTPAIRFEQNNTGGFTAQTWDIAGNEANFFVRDVTGGSRLPFRIRPGAPTSSIDISATGNVGINTASPDSLLEIEANQPDAALNLLNTAQFSRVLFRENGTERAAFQFIGSTFATADRRNAIEYFANFGPVIFYTAAVGAGTERMRIDTAGRVGIATNAPTDTLSVNGTASKPGGGTWAVFSDERLKNINGRYTRGLRAVLQLQPVRYEYKSNNALGINSRGEHIGFGAQSIEKIIPEAVSKTENGYLMVNNDPIIWTMLNAIKEQQAQIQQLQTEVRRLRSASRRRR